MILRWQLFELKINFYFEMCKIKLNLDYTVQNMPNNKSKHFWA